VAASLNPGSLKRSLDLSLPAEGRTCSLGFSEPL
jgi:hypothetical protein